MIVDFARLYTIAKNQGNDEATEQIKAVLLCVLN